MAEQYLDKIWASAGSVDSLTEAKWNLGWVAEIPTAQDMNFILKALTENALIARQQGTSTWSSKIAYEKGTKTRSGSLDFYALEDNTNVPPSNLTEGTWSYAPAFTSDRSYSVYKTQGLTLRHLSTRASSSLWRATDITIMEYSPNILFADLSSYDNWILGNIKGVMSVVNVENNQVPDDRSFSNGTVNKSYAIYHQGNKPTQAEISGTIPDAPQDGTLYARGNGGWTAVTTTTFNSTPPTPTGSGNFWYNLEDGQTYVDLPDQDTNQWTPANSPIIPVETDKTYTGNLTVGGKILNSLVPIGSGKVVNLTTSPALTFASNITAVTRVGVGHFVVHGTFGSNYTVFITNTSDSDTLAFSAGSLVAANFRVYFKDLNGNLKDPSSTFSVLVMGE